MSQQRKVSNNDIIGTLTALRSLGQCYFHVTYNMNMSQQWKEFKQRYYRNLNNLCLCRPVILSSNVQSEHVAAVEFVQKRYYRNINLLSLCRPVLLSGNVQSEHVAEVARVRRTILLDHYHFKPL